MSWLADTSFFLCVNMIYLVAGSENGGDPSKLTFFQAKCQKYCFKASENMFFGLFSYDLV